MAKEKKSRVNINNKRASFDYEFLETYTAGIVLVGTEIKSIRAGRASMSDAFCFFEKGQLYVRGINIALARGKKQYDKRQSIKEKDLRREMERGE